MFAITIDTSMNGRPRTMNRPKLILADEPGGNLDGPRASQLHDLLLRLVESERCALLVVTHDAKLAGRTDQWFELQEGSLRRRGHAEPPVT